MFFWRGRYFSGLVSGCGMEPVKGGEKVISGGALYDDPEDSFAAHVWIKSSLDEGLIVPRSNAMLTAPAAGGSGAAKVRRDK